MKKNIIVGLLATSCVTLGFNQGFGQKEGSQSPISIYQGASEPTPNFSNPSLEGESPTIHISGDHGCCSTINTSGALTVIDDIDLRKPRIVPKIAIALTNIIDNTCLQLGIVKSSQSGK